MSAAQEKYTVTELELLSIVECFKEFTGMLWGQKIKVYTDHKNLVRNALGLSSNRIFRWRLTLEEYNPMLAYLDYSEPFEIFTDASTRQLGAVITQKRRPLAFLAEN